MANVFYYGFPNANADDRWTYWETHRPPAVAFDIETVSLDERHPIGIGVAFSPQEAFYFKLGEGYSQKGLEALGKILADVRIVKIAHNIMFDMGVFPLIPDIGSRLDRANIFDTNVAARLLGYQFTALSDVLPEFGLSTTPADQLLKKYGVKTMSELDPMVVADHCAQDCKGTYRIWMEWEEKIHKQYGEYFKVEMAVIPILLDLSMQGIEIDQKSRQELEDRYTIETEFYRRHIQSFGIENPGSAKQVGLILADRGNFLKFTKSKRQLKTDEASLEFLDDPLAAAVLQYRKKSKFLNTYLLPLKGEDRFYTEYYLDTVVGRLNSRNRNIQNIPGADADSGDPGARFMLVPNSGTFTTGDFAKEHMFILAQLSQDRKLLEVLYDPDPKRSDVHQLTADLIHTSRKIAKVVNYAMPYGGTAETISENGKIRDKDFCEHLLESWFRAYPGAADWIKYAQREGMRTGWALPTMFNRRIRIPQDESENKQRNKAVNYPILGSDGEVIKRAIILCNNRRLGPPVLAMTVHDSLTWDGDVEDKIPKEELEQIPGYRIPFEIKQTVRWE